MGPGKCWRRELAAQVAAVGRTLQRTAGLRCAMLYGGAERAGQARLKHICPIAVGKPLLVVLPLAGCA